MKTDPCYADLDEFWVIGDFVAKSFMTWGGDRHGCYVDGTDPLRAERFSSYKEAAKYAREDKDAREWMEGHGGPRFVFAKPLRCRKSVTVYPPGRRP